MEAKRSKTPMYCQENRKFEKRCCMQFSLIQVGQSFKCLVHLVIQSVLKKVKEIYNKKRQSKGWSGVHLLHDNASSHKCEVVKSFLASEKVKVLNHPPAGLGGSVGCAVRLETRRSRVQPPPRSATFFRGD